MMPKWCPCFIFQANSPFFNGQIYVPGCGHIIATGRDSHIKDIEDETTRQIAKEFSETKTNHVYRLICEKNFRVSGHATKKCLATGLFSPQNFGQCVRIRKYL
jgi:hypothetical protein